MGAMQTAPVTGAAVCRVREPSAQWEEGVNERRWESKGSPMPVTILGDLALLAHSSNDGSVQERRSLHERFVGRLSVNPLITPRMVSFRGNHAAPGFRWMKYKEGFSVEMVELLLERAQPSSVLDPFSGIGTCPLIAAGKGLSAIGIEIIPVGFLAGNAIAVAANRLQFGTFSQAGASLLEYIDTSREIRSEHAYPHVRITEKAFPPDTESALAKAREFISSTKDADIVTMLNLACMSVLESVSYTQKDGQYLRWDQRSGKSLNSQFQKKSILKFKDALERRLVDMVQDIDTLRDRYGRGAPDFIRGSNLDSLSTFPSGSFDMVITSPPYANRYDYTRIYALEIAWLGYNDEGFKRLRQSMLSATVENKSKREWLLEKYPNPGIVRSAISMYENQGAVQEVIGILNESLDQLSNRHVVRMLEGYFLEMALVVAELGRIVKPGGTVVMVCDNVQYHGEELPVDLILSDFAEESGFVCEHIWKLPRGKGNPSQQMRRFGRREQRKCVYWWVRENG